MSIGVVWDVTRTHAQRMGIELNPKWCDTRRFVKGHSGTYNVVALPFVLRYTVAGDINCHRAHCAKSVVCVCGK